MTRTLCGTWRVGGSLEVNRRRGSLTRATVEHARDVTGVLELANLHGDIDAALDQIDPSIFERDVEHDIRVRCRELGHAWQKRASPEEHRHRDP